MAARPDGASVRDERGHDDIRLTTRYDEGDLGVSLFAEHPRVRARLLRGRRRPGPRADRALVGDLDGPPRVAEPACGRTSSAAGFPPGASSTRKLQEAFPASSGTSSSTTYYRAINKVQPSLIRVEADEATYNLHIILRFELEQEILSGELPLEDLPEAWNARMADYLGIDVPDDAHGVLQDVHWSGGAIGYFPTYALGNVISVQLWDQLRADIPDLDAQFEQGEFGELDELAAREPAPPRAQVHVHGDARAHRRRPDGPGAVPALPPGEAGRDLRPAGRDRRPSRVNPWFPRSSPLLAGGGAVRWFQEPPLDVVLQMFFVVVSLPPG